MPEVALESPTSLVNVIYAAGLVESKSQVRRLIKQGGVRLDGRKVEDVKVVLDPPGEARTVQVGKRRFLKIRKSNS